LFARNLSTLAFTICFSTFLLLFVQWRTLFFCSTDSTCDAILGLRSGVFTSPSTGDVVVFIYFTLFCLYLLWNCAALVVTLRDAFEMRAFYRDDLNISDVRNHQCRQTGGGSGDCATGLSLICGCLRFVDVVCACAG